ncbi:BirA family transcriptional regulator, biotin operon repressor / biotin-[acetyl-CoA-carboxylase] ligase [Thermoanaerobacter uzonensis DSM 18761]|jgi:BirA family biotin operon repressor/biotin-[acetyl-CoA-carboxylase] ligase|uniref:Bifunctional ligase/repressor BirA n=1 Tax=Thermoanaerobacter uzonensis DSM 18761 TaxID=1123369 RepID=A0A1M4VTM0_9THEO|nr:biotin--[acetyl-CoA-carboxylase] ligase [Thermoanaerobacter uzonensis]SHE72384.1 BirA family transcriptional regulator, biotin operon repressor / biotin-[acetyl-CoA-carboxylase] ligase [Thermoanaerobacter uzonensis DSM 18761]
MLRQRLLRLLKENKGEYISGQKLSDELNVSRTAIWKHINELKNEGYQIEAHHKLGYILLSEPDLLIYEEVSPYLTTDFIGKNYIHKLVIDSTNNLAKEIASNVPDGTVIIAEEQTAGRGRLGRSWISQKGCGIWMSIILKPNIQPQEAINLTQVAAISVVKAIEEVFHVESKIKWPNDIILNNKKVCGILTEMSSEIDKINYVIIGIGVNVNCDNFPEELKGKATSLYLETNSKVDRKKLTASILNNLEFYYNAYLQKGFVYIRPICIEKSITIGRQIKVIANEGEIEGKAVTIDNNGSLVVETKEGKRLSIMSGDVSVRGLLDYV